MNLCTRHTAHHSLFVRWCLVPGLQDNEYPFLKSFLETSNRGAVDVIRGEVQSTCADPKRWLNPAGHSLLSELPGFEQYNASMLWGTYRPGVYFGERTIFFATGDFCSIVWIRKSSVALRSYADTSIAGKNVAEMCSSLMLDDIGVARATHRRPSTTGACCFIAWMYGETLAFCMTPAVQLPYTRQRG